MCSQMSENSLQQEINNIVLNTDLSDREKLDILFEWDSVMYTKLGSDSTLGEIEETKKRSRMIYRGIKVFDRELGDQLLRTQDVKKTKPENTN